MPLPMLDETAAIVHPLCDLLYYLLSLVHPMIGIISVGL